MAVALKITFCVVATVGSDLAKISYKKLYFLTIWNIYFMPGCMLTGYAGGIACGMAVKNNISINNIDIEKLKDKLK